MKEQTNRKQLKDYLRMHHIESVFPAELQPYLSLYHFDPGEWVCSQGEALENVYVLVKGKLKVYTTSAEGKTLILSFQKPLAVIGDIEYVQGIDIINTVEAVSPVVMIGVHHHLLKRWAGDHPPLLQFLLYIITEKFYMKSTSLNFHFMYPVDVRLASYLLSVSFDESHALFEGKLSTASLRDAANLIGTSYRHMNRVIQSFCAQGLVERKKGCIIVKDRQGLQALAGQSIYEPPGR
ncbi:cyclic nucleotide-binding domain-containing protein [Domibacillus sp. PGB-M46]|uniref:Crp/Fnr family transcriptional regulator n=1 Tax=Domibacillus sp. PGB-M46 TaxID=2910255 RepID=UPI001F5AB61F|nr:cyclic nucleotide-binding domain-containing protein [Domibacillus sp. PGB-M46]MCI2255833.1 cyclic nucleotide-binding domain-containing protein [Domibacillus sp. PGB-M46]